MPQIEQPRMTMMMKARMMKILRVAARSANHQLVPNVEAKPKRRERRWNVVRVHIDWNMNILIWVYYI